MARRLVDQRAGGVDRASHEQGPIERGLDVLAVKRRVDQDLADRVLEAVLAGAVLCIGIGTQHSAFGDGCDVGEGRRREGQCHGGQTGKLADGGSRSPAQGFLGQEGVVGDFADTRQDEDARTGLRKTRQTVYLIGCSRDAEEAQ
ncbi:hypothetical protein AHiyo8_11250 [Arthrobacter sp. Hiyo8]|nr:hypothetical protein AHiyo8_11250 [Arthrobacter sp. Hiyo8]